MRGRFSTTDIAGRRTTSSGGRRTSSPPCSLGQSGDLDAVYACVGRLVRALGSAGLLRACVPAAYGGAREKIDVRSLCLAREILGSGLGSRRFRICHAGSIQHPDHAVRQRRSKAEDPAGNRQRNHDRRLRIVGTGRGIGRRSHHDSRRARRRLLAPRWGEDLDLQRRPCRLLRRLRSHRRGTRNQGLVCVHRRWRHARTRCVRAHRGHRPAPIGHAALHRVPGSGRSSAGKRGRGIQDRHGHARCLPVHGGRRGARLRTASVRRSNSCGRSSGARSAARSPSSN